MQRRRRRESSLQSTPYSRREFLLSWGELAFYAVLRKAVDGRFLISIKTRLADVVACPEELWETVHGRRLSQKHLDFVLYDRFSTRIIAAVELDDRSHDRPERRERDRFIDQTLADVGITLIRVRAARMYDVPALALRLAGLGESGQLARDTADAKTRTEHCRGN